MNTTTELPVSIKPVQRLLVDSCSVRLQLVEGAEPGKLVVRGEFAKCGVATENKRVYPKEIWEREIGRLKKAMSERRLYGTLDHPGNGKTELANVSHIITSLEIKDGLIIGEAEILDTAKGRDIKAILQAAGTCGVSSRGFGSVRSNEKGEDVVQPDYRLVTWDFVADPADQDALPEAFNEENTSMDREEHEKALEKKFTARIEAAIKDAKDAAEVSLRDEFAKDLLAKLDELRGQVTEQVRGELLSDPAVAGAKTAVDKIKDILGPLVLPEDAVAITEQKNNEISGLKNQLAEQSLKIKDLEGQVTKLENVAKEAGYKFFIEKLISADPDADLIRKLVGDVTRFEDSEALKAQVESIRTDLASKRETAEKLAGQIQAQEQIETERKEKERARTEKSEKALREENSKLREALDKALEVAHQGQLQNYVETRLRNHPEAEKIRPLIESASSEKEVDKVLSKFREIPRQPEQVESVRARVRKLTQGGEGPNAIEEESPAQSRSEPGHYEQLGVTLNQIREMAGMNGSPYTLNKK